MATKPVPSTTDTIIVFPLNIKIQQFDTASYNPTITQGKSSLEEIKKVLEDIESSRKPLHRSLELIVFLYIILECLAIVALVFSAIISKSSEFTILRYLVFIIVLIVLTLVMNKAILKNLKKQKKAAEDVLVNYRPDFASKGLNWIVPEGFPRWIELHKDYLYYPVGMRPIDLPPTDQQSIVSEENNQYNPPTINQV